MPRCAKFTLKKRERFLAGLALGGSVTKAAQEARISPRAAYKARESDEAFADLWRTAVDSGTDLIEDEVLRRAKDGVRKPVYYQGKRVGFVQEYSDTLAMFLLKARRPDRYRDNVEPNNSAQAVQFLKQMVQQMKNGPAKDDGDPNFDPDNDNAAGKI